MKLFNLIPLAVCLSFSAHAAPQRALSLDDIMHFETLQQPVISDDGKVIAVQATPDRGDSRALIPTPLVFQAIHSMKLLMAPMLMSVLMENLCWRLLKRAYLNEKPTRKPIYLMKWSY